MILVSCSGHHIVTARDCAGEGVWYDQEFSDENVSADIGFEFETSSTVFLPILFWNTTDVADVLQDNKVNCSDLENLSVEYNTNTFSFLTRILPFFNTYNVKVTGTLKRNLILNQEDDKYHGR